jgi:putative FmdB family regulatory protein
MPIYAYKCSSCQHELDVLQKISDAPLTVCPSCGAATLVKQLTAAGFQLKGSGWYATDFKNGGAKPEAKPGEAKPAADKPEGEAQAKPEARTDSKPEGKPAEAKDSAAPAASPAASVPGGGASG